MIHAYSDHAANERTYLAWVRTGIAVIAFGFVIEKFNLFMLTIAVTALGTGPGDAARRLPFERLAGSVGHYDGLALIFGGIALIVVATVRFIRTTRLLDDPEEHAAKSVRAELITSAGLVLLITSYSLYLAFS